MKRNRVINSDLYSSLLLSIISGNNYPKKIAEHIKSDFGNVSRQLKYLERKKFVNSELIGDKKIFPFQKRIYSINWDKIIDELIEILIDIKKEKNGTDKS